MADRNKSVSVWTLPLLLTRVPRCNTPFGILYTISYYRSAGGHYIEFLDFILSPFWLIHLFPGEDATSLDDSSTSIFCFYDYYVIHLSTSLKEFVIRLLFFGLWHFRIGTVDSLTRMDLTQFSTVVALANTSVISICTLELWKLSNFVSAASFTLKMMR